MALTKQQAAILTALNDDGGQDGHGIGTVLRKKFRDSAFGSYYDRAIGALARLEKRGLVRRNEERPAKWWITSAGLAELEARK